MFIKVFVPNHNGKIELSVQELETLIKEAVDKAIIEDRANRPYQSLWCNSITLSDNTPREISTKPELDKFYYGPTITCDANLSDSGLTGSTSHSPINMNTLQNVIK
jgi:hypothetical protein